MKRDRRLEDRHAPLQRPRRRLVRIAPLLGPPPQPLHVVARVAALARRPRQRLRAHEAAADVGVERGAADAQQRGGVRGGHPRGSGISRTHIDCSINVDTIIHERYCSDMVNSGLDGVVAATTRLSDVDGERGELVIAGYPVGELAAHASFEETTWLLWHGALPSAGCWKRFVPARRRAGAAAGGARAAARMRRAAHRSDGRAAHRRRHNLADFERCRTRSSAQFPTIVAAFWRLRARRRAARTAARSRARRELPLHAERRRPGCRARARARDLSQHRRRPRPQRLDLHRARHHLHRIRPGLGGRRRARRAERAAARRRARPGARHGVRDRRRLARRGRAAPQDRERRAS